MWGAGVGDRGTIPSHVAAVCAQRGVAVEVVNYGQLGYVSTQELITVIRALEHGERPKVVITYDGYNDVLTALDNGRAGLAYQEDHRRHEFNLLRHTGRLALSMLNSLALVRLVRRSTPKYPQRSASELEAIADQVFDIAVTNARCLKALGREFGFDVLTFWQPTIFDKPQLSSFEREQRALIEFSKPVFTRLRERLRAQQLSEIFLLDDVFRHAERPYFIDWAHLSEHGNLLIAQRIVEQLLPKLRGAATPGIEERCDDHDSVRSRARTELGAAEKRHE
jgi:hypothetical protein